MQAHCRPESRRTSKLPGKLGSGKPTFPTRSWHRRRERGRKPTHPARGRQRAWGQGAAAKERRQKEAAADRHQAAAGERPPSSVGEETRSVPLSATDPRCKLCDTVSADQPQLTAARVGRAEILHSDPGLNCDPATRHRMEARCELARYLKAGHRLLVSACGAAGHPGSRRGHPGFTDSHLSTRQRGARALHNPSGCRSDQADGEAAIHGRERRRGLTGHGRGETQLQHGGHEG